MYETYDYNYENYEEINKGLGEGDPNNGMKEFNENLDEKHTSINKNEKKTQNLIKILIAVIIIFIILLLIIGIFMGYTYFLSDTLTPPPATTTPTPTTTPLPLGKQNAILATKNLGHLGVMQLFYCLLLFSLAIIIFNVSLQASCPDGDGWIQFDGFCYLTSPTGTGMTWYEAQEVRNVCFFCTQSLIFCQKEEINL